MSCRKGDRKVEVRKGGKKKGEGCRKEEEGVRKVEKAKREKKNGKKKTFSIICFANFV